MSLTGKVALITGAAEGMGKAIAEEFLKNGAKAVYLADINEKLGQETLENLRSQYGADKAVFDKCDVTSKEQLEAAFKGCVDKFGHLDIVCNNAGFLNEFKWELMLSVNLNAVIEGTYLAVKYMGTQNGGKGGVVINTSSIVGLIPRQYAPIYTASKHGVIGFTRAVAFEPAIQDNRIRVVAICPMVADTSFFPFAMEHGTKYTDDFTKVFEAVPFLKLPEITSTVMHLLEDTTSVGTANAIFPGKGFKAIPPPKLD
ncbi:15-hydroxyprostaglandin dehydrogenase [NAD(+)]-like [Glandiceps talaboti]